MEIKSCKNCQTNYEIKDSDLAFYNRLDVPIVELCHGCRRQERLAFRNERNLYKRKCDLTGKPILSIYSKDKPFKVYDQETWWSEKWNPLDFGRDFDFSRSFFEQFKELMLVVPRRNLAYFQSENSDYTNFCSYNKDCYLLFSSDYNHGCLYVSNLQKCTDCVDCYIGSESELCYECFNFHKSYQCVFSKNIDSCSECIMVDDCKNCKNCLFCKGLRGKQFYICNKPYSKEQYYNYLASLNLGNSKSLIIAKQKFHDFFVKQPCCCSNNINTENCSGDYLRNSKNCANSFNVSGSEDCSYICDSVDCKNCLDCDETGNSELCYQTVDAFPNVYNSTFILFSANTSFMDYCDHCYNSQNLFACVGLKKHKYCIFNKQYSEADYKILRSKIVDHMKKNGEWGNFFPKDLAPFVYNESSAYPVFPLTKAEAVSKGYKWKEDDEKKLINQNYQAPDQIADVNNDILEKILVCEETGKNYKIIPQELNFYKKLKLPIPKKSPDRRNFERYRLRNPAKLWERNCGKCQAAIKTTYSPERPEIVYCEKCYLESLY